MSTQFGLKRAIKVAGTLAAGALVCAGVLGSGLQAQAGAPSSILSGPERAGKIEASVTRDLADDGSASIVILLKDQANLTAAYSMKDQDARGWYVDVGAFEVHNPGNSTWANQYESGFEQSATVFGPVSP